MSMNSSGILVAALCVVGLTGAAVYVAQAERQPAGQASSPTAMVVYKTPTCGCCSLWVEHMRKAGFEVDARDVTQTELDAIKAKHNVPASMQSCHTGLIGGYAIEGHIPAAEVRRFLTEKPAVAGLAVPGMPLGSPGMEVPGAKARPYSVLTFDRDGRTQVFATVQP
jgi:hypothetical protein